MRDPDVTFCQETAYRLWRFRRYTLPRWRAALRSRWQRWRWRNGLWGNPHDGYRRPSCGMFDRDPMPGWLRRLIDT